jgi:peptidoglycan hydrolase-like protein with peptidoglycan-binding domain
MWRLRRIVLTLLLSATFAWGCAPGLSHGSGEHANSVQPTTATPQPGAPGHASGSPSQTSKNTSSPPANVSPSAPKPVPPKYPVLNVGNSGANVLRLQQLLAMEGYLPLVWHSKNTGRVSSDALSTLQLPPDGTWTWRYSNVPSWVQPQWKPGSYTVLVQGAVMTYQQAHHLPVDGVAGPQVWTSLLANAGKSQNPYGLTYVQVTLKQPQTLTVWWNGKQVLQTLVNTGIPQSPTVAGTYAVYLQFSSQRMSGTDPWGHHYDDPGVPYVSYFYKGEAIHGFVRAHYGYPQSLGCVELPVNNAKVAWTYIHYGTLVHLQ